MQDLITPDVSEQLKKAYPPDPNALTVMSPEAIYAGVHNHGPIDYYKEMPYVFVESKINLNITLRSIKTGIPLRALDIMGSGGFLLTNFQSKFLEYFTPDEDFVYYNDYNELMDKVDCYLIHEKERKEIALNGCEKVRIKHTYRQRIEEMMNIAGILGNNQPR